MRFDIRSTFIVILASLTIVNASSSSDAFIVEYTNDTLPASYLLSDYIVITSATNNKSCFAYRSSATDVVFGFGTPDSPKILQATVESGSVFTVAAVPSSTQCILFYTKQDGQAAGVNFYALREDISTTSPYPFNGLRDVSNTLTAVLDPSNPSNGFILATAGIYNGVTVRYGMLRYDDSVSASPFSDLAAVDVTIATNNEVEQLNLHQYGAQSLSVLLLLKNGSQIWAGNINVAGTSFSGYNSLYYSNVLGIASQSISSGSTGAFCYTTISNEFVCNQWTPSNSTFGSEISRGPSTSKSIALSLLAHDSTAAVLFGQNGTSFFARQLQSGQLLSNNPFTLNLGSTSTMSFAATNANSDDMISLLVRDTSSGKMYLALVRHDWCGDGIQNSFEQCNSCDCTATPSSIPSTSSPIPGSGGSPTASPAKEPIDAPNLSGKTPTNGPTTEPPQVAVIVPAVVIPVVVVAAGLIILLVLLRRRKKRKGSLLHGKSRVEIAMESIDDRLKIPYKSLVFKKEIGAGSYGKVYVGEWKGTPVAIKVSSSVTDMDGFFDEARITVGLQQHPNVVQTFGVSLDGQLPCIVLEFCEGGSLDNRLFDSDVTMTQQQKIALIKGISRGLYHLHTNNIVHRDLAARNVLLNKSGTPKISDFGMSRVLKSEAEKGKTKTNYGPIRWMAPESLRDLQYSTKSDVWSFGIVLYEVVSRNEPHIDIDPLEVAVKIKNESYHPSIPQNVEPVLREIMLSCWQPDPNNRPSMEQICNKLNTSFPDD